LHRWRPENAVHIAGRNYFLAVAVTVGGCGLAAPDLDVTNDARPKLLTELGTSPISTSSVTREQTTSDALDEVGPLDFYGNEVTDAVMEYKLDAGGSLYETHSPQTELPHPTSPRG
jgi:hypothetical protein